MSARNPDPDPDPDEVDTEEFLDGLEELDEDHHTGYYLVTVREKAFSDERALGVSLDSNPPDIRGTQDYGCGTDLKVPAFEEIEDRVDLEEPELGDVVATVYVDYDAWTYSVDCHQQGSLLDRFRRMIR